MLTGRHPGARAHFNLGENFSCSLSTIAVACEARGMLLIRSCGARNNVVISSAKMPKIVWREIIARLATYIVILMPSTSTCEMRICVGIWHRGTLASLTSVLASVMCRVASEKSMLLRPCPEYETRRGN